MRLTFGMHLDGVDWSRKPASMGELKLGPAGMLNLLETRLALTQLYVHPAQRINQYMKRMGVGDGPGKWFHDSFAADPWSTAKEMLGWRDQLVEAGWGGSLEASGSPRLRALAEFEQADIPLDAGSADRLQRVLKQLRQTKTIAISHIRLHEPPELLPPVWQQIMARLESLGVSIEAAAGPATASNVTNLTGVQSMLNGGSKKARISPDDDSLLLIEAADEWEAADNLALWLAADPSANQDVTIICHTDTDVLDQALVRRGLPQLGDSESSRWRASLQILPLVLANSWQPLDIFRLVELLSSPLAPLPRYAAGSLLRAISKEPGTGGGVWNDALDKISETYKTRGEEDGNNITDEEAAAFAAGLDEFLTGERFDPEVGIPAALLKERCQRLIESLAWRAADDPPLGEAVSHAREMQRLAEGKGTIPRVAVERMLDSVIGTGSSAPDRFRQAAPWRVVNHPGQVTDETGTIIWWGFIDQPVQPQSYWSDSERKCLAQAGVKLEGSRIHRSREAYDWRLGFSQARAGVLMFYPASMRGEPAYHNPFWEEILAAAALAQPDLKDDEIKKLLTRKCTALNDGGRWQLAGRTARLQKAAKSEPAAPETEYTVPKGVIAAPQKLSYSQMSTMIGCPMRWALQFHSWLKAPAVFSIPTGNLLIGNLCHQIVQELYAEPAGSRTADAARARALALYDSLVKSMAAELLAEGRELESSRVREAIAQAIAHLVEEINRLNLTVEKSEAELEGEFPGNIPFTGRADLLLSDKRGNTYVFDLKWTSSSSYLSKELEEGYALQLATYTWLLRRADPGKVHAGYFLLAQCEMLSGSELLNDAAIEAPYSLTEVWERGVRSWDQSFEELSSGVMKASGVRVRQLEAAGNLGKDKLKQQLISDSHSQGLVYQESKCGFCDFAVLCGAGGEL